MMTAIRTPSLQPRPKLLKVERTPTPRLNYHIATNQEGRNPPSPSIHHQEAHAPVAPSPPAICSTCGGEGAIWQPGLDAHGVHWGIQCNACERTGRLLGPPSPLAWEELGLGIPPEDSHDAANTCDPDEATNSDDGGSDGTSTPTASPRTNQQCRFCCPECNGKGHLIRPASPPLATECDLCHGEGGGSVSTSSRRVKIYKDRRGITTALSPHSTTTDGTRQEALKARATHAWMQQPTTRMPSTTGVCRQDYSTTTTCDQR